MSSRPLLPPYSVITNGNMTGAITSSVTIVQGISMPSYQAVWSGTTPIGTLTVEGSNTYTQNADGSTRNAGSWTPLYFSTNGAPPAPTMAVTGNTGTGVVDIETSLYAIRIRYTPTSGTGTLNVTVNGKVS